MDFDEDGFIIFPFYNIDLSPPPITPKFHLFLNLPTEIRIKIWILAHPGPRSVLVSLGNHSRRSHFSPPSRPERCLAHLFVNHEAKAIFLEHYERIFTYAESDRPRGRGGGSYLNFVKDSLCVTSGLKGVRYLLQRFPQDMLKIQYLDINVDKHAMHARRLSNWATCPLKISDLPELKLVTLRRMTFALEQVQHDSAFRGDFATTLEVLQKAFRHQHEMKHCEKEKFVRLAVQCVYSEDARPQFRDLFTILWPLGKDVVERWEGMEDMFVEQSGGVVSRRRRLRCRSGEIELHQNWERRDDR
jgi:hypothetical protein